jgi:hypothetical protein
MTKIGELYRRDGVWNGQQIVPSAWIHQCTSPSKFQTEIGGPSDDEYGLLWWVIENPNRRDTTHLGAAGNSSSCCRNREQ